MRALARSDLDYDFNAYDIDGKIYNYALSSWVSKVVANYADYRIPAAKISDADSSAIEEWFAADTPARTVWFELRVRGATYADSYVVFTQDLEAERARQVLTNKHIPTTGAGKTTLVVRNDDDSANVLTINSYDPATGDRANPTL